MAKYIVDAQVQKANAIVAAENSIKQKYEEKLKLLSGTAQGTQATTISTTTATTDSIPAFQQRSAKVSAAAAAGKSRWGDLENQKATQVATAVNGAVVADKAVVTPPRLAVSPPSTRNSAFDQRNAMVAAAGRAGKSRWGEMEVARATQAVTGGSLPSASTTATTTPPPTTTTSVPVSTASITVPPEVEAADHGLRADGGVGGPSLAERINFGAQLLQGSVTATVPAPLGSTPAPTSSASSSYYQKRNAMVAAAGRAGKSRWGEMEVQKVQTLVASLPSSNSATPIKVSPEIEAADHGLRADGGVGGPTLAQRVNFGAALLEQ